MKANTMIAAAVAVAIGVSTFPAMARGSRASFIDRSCERLRFESAGFKGPIKLTIHHPVWNGVEWEDVLEEDTCRALAGGEGTPARDAQVIGRVKNPFR